MNNRNFQKAKMCHFYPNPVCVEVAITENEVAIRDSKNIKQEALVFDYAEWSAFIDGVKNGEFDV